MMGLATADASGLSGTISGSVAFKGDLRNASSMTVTLNVSPIDAKVFDVPIVLSRGLRAAMTDGRVEIDDATMTIGGVAVRARGGASTDQPEGKLSLDLDGDIGTLQPWLNRVPATHEPGRGRANHRSCRDRQIAGRPRIDRNAQCHALDALAWRPVAGEGCPRRDRSHRSACGSPRDSRFRVWWPAQGHGRSAAGLAERLAAIRLADRSGAGGRSRHDRRHGIVRCASVARSVRTHGDEGPERRRRTLREVDVIPTGTGGHYRRDPARTCPGHVERADVRASRGHTSSVVRRRALHRDARLAWPWLEGHRPRQRRPRREYRK